MKRNFYLSLITLLFCGIFMSSCGQKSDSGEYLQTEGMIWHTSFHITFKGPENLKDSVLPVLNRVGKSLNFFDPTSLVSQVNASDSVKVDNDFIKVYAMSVRVNRLTKGAFDPTLSPLITAWGFGRGHTATADTAKIDSILNFVGIDKTRMAQDAIIKSDPRIQFNFSAIAKGYGADAVGKMFIRNGVTDFLVEIGGEIAAHGISPSGGKWRISIDRPILQDSILHQSQCVIAFTDMGLATSGNYRNFQTDPDGNRYGHTISATTGRPARTDVLSATVLASSSMEADALATAFMALGSQQSKELIRKMRLPAMLILSDSSVYSSPAFTRLLQPE